jgi:hypothetical protein
MRIVVAALFVCAVAEAGWMAFDGTQSFVTGALVTRKSGPRAGELGPWHYLTDAVGLEGHGRAMRVIFAVYGWSWLAVIAGYALGASWGWKAMVIMAAGALWYLPVGTAFSVTQLALLFWRGPT